MGRAPRSASATGALLLAGALWMSGCGGNDSDAASPEGERDLYDEYVHLQTARSLLEARWSLSRSDHAYLIVDLTGRRLGLELQGVPLAEVPVEQVRLNEAAREALGDTIRFRLIEEPFVVQAEDWVEKVPTLAAKDSAAVLSRPDTTGRLAARIREAAILGVLRCDRGLVLALDGRKRPASLWDHVGSLFGAVGRLLRRDPVRSALDEAGEGSLLIRCRCDPAAVRALAPNLQEGTPVVLRF
ncbi:MAG: hypothetical protein GF346_13550 [Candidatus Eisenbacteria bacterium]|nr:hypothetical protein [Candidatus Latescibacterota bacterium]MBD3303465.1 hypothetical protein [Candidatus Eisenbacteria bacterium]